MLPNLQFLVGGVLFCLLLFVVAGAGVATPDSPTHFGEMPAVERPMMQRSMAEAPAQQARFYRMALARRRDELERLRERAAEDAAAATAPPASGHSRMDGPQPDVRGADVSGSDIPKADFPKPEAGENGPVPPVADLTPPPAKDGETAAPFAKVPLPPSRPAAFNGWRRHGRVFRRRHRIVQQPDAVEPAPAPIQGVLPNGQAIPANPGVAAGYSSPVNYPP